MVLLKRDLLLTHYHKYTQVITRDFFRLTFPFARVLCDVLRVESLGIGYMVYLCSSVHVTAAKEEKSALNVIFIKLTTVFSCA